MVGKWPLTAIGDVAEVFDGPHATPKTVDSGPIFLGIGALQSGRINLGETRHVTAEDFKTWTRRVKPQGGDVVFSYETRLGEAALIPDNFECCLGRRMGLVRTNRELLDPRFFLYIYLSPYFQELIRSRTIPGATVDRIALKEFPFFPIPLPKIEEQRVIAHILGTLDDKIELNRRRNQTLEAMARALFKDWFVDFGPVRAKMEGREPYLPADLWQLFPDRLDDEGKPEGWIQQRVGDTGSIICGKTPPTKNPEYYGEDVPFITIPEMHGNIFATDVKKRLSHKGAASQAKKMLPSGSICVSCIATLGLVIITTEPSQTNQQINSVIPAQENETYFWYWAFKNLGEEIKAGGSGGSVLGNLSTGRFSELQVNASTASLRFAYNARVKNLFAQILANERESRTLAQLRDTLLPKLISGELRIVDAKQFLEPRS